MCLLWIVVGVLLLFLMWGRRREGLESNASAALMSDNATNLTMSADPNTPYKSCEACTGAGKFWNNLKKMCGTTEGVGYKKSCVLV